MVILRYTPSLTFLDPQESWEETEISRILRIRDTACESNYRYRQGHWDGYADFRVPTTEGYAVYSGMLPYLLERLDAQEIPWSIDHDPRDEKPPEAKVTPDLLDGITLREYQVEAANEALRKRRGVLSLPPRSGKTEIQAAVVKALGLPSLLLVDRETLLHQHAERLQSRGISVGKVGGGSYDIQNIHIVGMVQTIARRMKSDPDMLDMLRDRQVIQADECHHIPGSRQWKDIFRECPAEYRLGYSGTPWKGDPVHEVRHADLWLTGCCGPEIYSIGADHLKDHGHIASATLFMLDLPATMNNPWLGKTKAFEKVYSQGIVRNDSRNQLITKIAKRLKKDGRKVLILVSRIEHGELLLSELHRRGVESLFSFGGGMVKYLDESGVIREADAAGQPVQDLKSGKISVLIGSTVYDEGVDIPALDALIIASAGRSPQRAIQRAYRGLTAKKGKKETVIVDFYDEQHFYLRAQANKRIKIYEDVGFTVKQMSPRQLSDRWSEEVQ